ncbi:hypothetical protein TNCV_2682761 [Trichonephila clavipes]|nr:hypothetical protein TNCV_2682761 [Trichonephila clavipes]
MDKRENSYTATRPGYPPLNNNREDHHIKRNSPPGYAIAYQLLRHSFDHQVANMAAKNDVNLALSPTFRYLSIESPL